MAFEKKNQIAALIEGMTYEEMIDFANDLVQMQDGLKDEPGGGWKPADLYGQFGMASMLFSWAENIIDEQAATKG